MKGGVQLGLHFLFAIIRKTLLSSLFHACVLFQVYVKRI